MYYKLQDNGLMPAGKATFSSCINTVIFTANTTAKMPKNLIKYNKKYYM